MSEANNEAVKRPRKAAAGSGGSGTENQDIYIAKPYLFNKQNYINNTIRDCLSTNVHLRFLMRPSNFFFFPQLHRWQHDCC